MSTSHFLASEIPNAAPGESFFHIIPAPYEASVSYGSGTAKGPQAILEASNQLELWDGYSRPADLGIHTQPMVDCQGDSAEVVLQRIAQATETALVHNKFPVILGGEHSVTWGVIQAYINAGYKDKLGVVQIDAHADLRDAYEGNRYSHASVMKRIVEQGIPLVQLGVRAYCEEEMEARAAFQVVHHDADELVPDQVQSIELPEDFPECVFFTVDVDGLDPSVFPSTGTPVPGGLPWYQTLRLFESVARQRQMVGFDLMEFAPIQSFHAYDFAAALLVYKLMGIVARNQ